MKKTEIYGSSDDLIEISGNISEEFYPHGHDDIDFLSFSDGTVLSIEYGKGGFWRINRVAAGTAEYVKVEGDDPEENYSDHVFLTGVDWVVFGSHFCRAIRPKETK
jgi:hypothetical protein